MWKIRQAIASFMYGRYGIDRLYWVLLGIWFVQSVGNMFVGSFIIALLEMAVMVLAIWRTMSRNIYQRRRENEQLTKCINSVKGAFSLTGQRIRDIGRKRYRKCKTCKAVLRLPINRGSHTVRCPRCAREFKVRILV